MVGDDIFGHPHSYHKGTNVETILIGHLENMLDDNKGNYCPKGQ